MKLTTAFSVSASLALLVVAPLQANEQDSNASAAKTELRQIFDELSTLQADFTQQVVDANGELVQELKGHLAMATPNQFFWQSNAPDELVLVADGRTVYYYDPFVDQVTLSDQTTASAQSPFLLLLDAQASAWADYKVSKTELSYQLEPTAANADQQALQINFVATDKQDEIVLDSLLLDDGQGQVTHIDLTNVQVDKAVPYSLFSFEIPATAVVDDQRAEQN
ncbi:outer membrane lipoprotein chaperone LolA [Pseudidiomarina sp. YC-516-91]|uniref:outer membrane lipoprotein chaperone LolA n=1 Tax=Pseudidiomarina salilacus TaxID=3384452 RepID=UPI0039852417